jgi:hypothetical protein
MNHLLAISKRILSSNTSKRIIISALRFGIFLKILGKSDAAAVSEAISKTLSKPFSESIGAADNVALSASKNLQDASSMSDAVLKLVTMSKGDTMQSSDAGYALNQDYVDNPFYFADDYVGVKQTF